MYNEALDVVNDERHSDARESEIACRRVTPNMNSSAMLFGEVESSVAAAAASKGKPGIISGETAGNPAFKRPVEMLGIKGAIRSTEFSAAEHLAREVLALSSIQKVKIPFALLLLKSQPRKVHQMIQIKRVSERALKDDGVRFLTERLWPRGIKKEDLKMDGWLKEAAPSANLRKWFSHDPAKWAEFQKRYWAELRKNPEAWQPILDAAKNGRVTLLFSSHDSAHNNVVALKAFLEKRKVNVTKPNRRRSTL